MIEMVPNTLSRDQIGKKIEGGLVDYFHQKYGPPNTESFQRVKKNFSSSKFIFCKARKNFLQSMAGYAVVSFLLQVKDRHNGNILLDEDGHIIHIGMKILGNF
jgi:phosphatidylinositol 4-kinase